MKKPILTSLLGAVVIVAALAAGVGDAAAAPYKDGHARHGYHHSHGGHHAYSLLGGVIRHALHGYSGNHYGDRHHHRDRRHARGHDRHHRDDDHYRPRHHSKDARHHGGHDSHAGCFKVDKVGYHHGRKALIGGKACRDAHGEVYVVPESRYVIHYY